MSELIRVPDLGGEGEVIELLVKVGDRVEAEQSILTLESDKASMEVPVPKAGIIKELKVKLGDRLKEGDELLVLEVEGAAPAAEPVAAAFAVDDGRERELLISDKQPLTLDSAGAGKLVVPLAQAVRLFMVLLSLRAGLFDSWSMISTPSETAMIDTVVTPRTSP